MQMLGEPVRDSVLGALKPLLLDGVVGISSGGETVSQGREVLVVVLDSQCRNDLVRILLELLGVQWVVLRRQDLDRHRNGIDLGLLEK